MARAEETANCDNLDLLRHFGEINDSWLVSWSVTEIESLRAKIIEQERQLADYKDYYQIEPG